MSITSAQCRAARALLGWTQDVLAEKSSVAKATIANFEMERRTPYERTLADLRKAFETAGVQLIPENGGGAGVRLAKRADGTSSHSEGLHPEDLNASNDD